MNENFTDNDSGVSTQDFADVMDELTDCVLAGDSVDIEKYVKRHPYLEQRLRLAYQSLQAVCAVRVPASLSHTESTDNVTPLTALGHLGDFRLVREIGRGGMGIVYEAEQISLARRVAVKVLPYTSLFDERQLRRFRTEALAAAALKHPRIVSVYSVGTERSVHFYAMELIDGHSLAEILQQRRSASQRSKPAIELSTDPIAAASTSNDRTQQSAIYRRVAQLGTDIATALDYAHQEGVIHRDIKPGNLLLDREGRVYVTDFGLARVATSDAVTLSGDIVGTLRYMSPEQLNDSRRVDERTDIYSLGVTLFELATGQPMFDADDRHGLIRKILEATPRSLRSVDSAAPRALATILLKATAKDPQERYSTAGELAADLQSFLERRPVKARMAGPWLRSWRWCQRNRRATVLGALVFALLSTLAAFGFQGKRQYAELASEQHWALYVSDIKRVQELSRQGKTDEARGVLARHVNDESRGFEWGLLLDDCESQVPQVVVKNRVECLSASFAPDGKRFVTTEWLQRAVVWDARTGEEVSSLESDRRGKFFDAKFSVDGQKVFVAHQAGLVHAWEFATHESRILDDSVGDLSKTFYPTSLAVSSCGKYLVAGYEPLVGQSVAAPAFVRIWDAESEMLVRRLDDVGYRVHDVEFSPDGRWLAIAGDEGSVRIVSTADWTVAKVLQGQRGDVNVIAFATDDDRLRLASASLHHHEDGGIGEIVLWDVVAETTLATAQHHEDLITALAFSPDGRWLAVGSHDKDVSLWNARDLTRIRRLRGHAAAVTCVTFSPDSQQLCTTSIDNSAKLWNVADLLASTERTNQYSGHRARAYSAGFTPDGQSVWSVDFDGGLRHWNVHTVETLCEVELGVTGCPIELSASPDDNYLAVAVGRYFRREVQNDELIVVSAKRAASDYGQVLWRSELSGPFSHGVVFSPESPNLCAVGCENGIEIWDVSTANRLLQIPLTEHIKQLDYSPDGRLLAVAGASGQLRIYRTADGSLVRAIKTEQSWGTLSAQFSPDGTQIATGGGDFMLRFWEVATGRLHSEVDSHDWILRVGFSPDGKRIFTTSKDGSITIWDPQRGEALITLASSADGEVWSAEFAPDGQALVAVAKRPFIWRATNSSNLTTVLGSVTDDRFCEPIPVPSPSSKRQ